jgi:hypothetical protein
VVTATHYCNGSDLTSNFKQTRGNRSSHVDAGRLPDQSIMDYQQAETCTTNFQMPTHLGTLWSKSMRFPLQPLCLQGVLSEFSYSTLTLIENMRNLHTLLRSFPSTVQSFRWCPESAVLSVLASNRLTVKTISTSSDESNRTDETIGGESRQQYRACFSCLARRTRFAFESLPSYRPQLFALVLLVLYTKHEEIDEVLVAMR